MKHLKNTVAAITMMAVLAIGTTSANAGIIIAGLKDDGGKGRTTEQKRNTNPCGTTRESGIIIAGLVGIIIAGYTRGGIIIAGLKAEPTVNCGIIIAG